LEVKSLEFRKLGKTRDSIPVVGMGTYGMGSDDDRAVNALRHGLDRGMLLIDTAEMYGSGHSEEVVSRAVEGRRDSVFVASKVSPSHFAYDDVLRSAQKSLKRLRLKQMDLYQLHWPNPSIPISETMRAMEKLANDGLTRYVGVSNFSIAQMQEAQKALSKNRIVSNQVEYSLLERSIEKDLLLYCQKEGVTVIAYSPLGQGKMSKGRGAAFDILDKVAEKLGKSRNQVALNWLLHQESVVVIPKAVRKEHLAENAESCGWRLDNSDYELVGNAFPRVF